MKRVAAVICALLVTGCSSQEALEDAQARAASAESEVEAIQSRLSVQDANLDEAQATLTALEAANSKLETDLADVKADYSRASKHVDDLSDEVGRYLCDKQITDMKYENVMDASTILAAWWARQPEVESVNTPYRDKIWSNALSQVHGIRFKSSEDHEQYVEHFMVYFDEFGMTPAIFWIGGQCWLDAPE